MPANQPGSLKGAWIARQSATHRRQWVQIRASFFLWLSKMLISVQQFTGCRVILNFDTTFP